MSNFETAIQAFLSTLAHESGGGGVISLDTLEPQGIAGVALFLRDGRVLVLGGGPA